MAGIDSIFHDEHATVARVIVRKDRSGLLKLESWPDLPHLPDSVVHDAARICALLSIRPTSPVLLARFLGISQERVDIALDCIMMSRVLGHDAGTENTLQDTDDMAFDMTGHDIEPVEAISISIFQKIWQRLRSAG